MPPLFGYKQLANFEVYSYPAAASYALGASVILLIARGDLAWRQARPWATGSARRGSRLTCRRCMRPRLAGCAASCGGAAALAGRRRAPITSPRPRRSRDGPPAHSVSPLQRAGRRREAGRHDRGAGRHVRRRPVHRRPVHLVGRGRPRPARLGHRQRRARIRGGRRDDRGLRHRRPRRRRPRPRFVRRARRGRRDATIRDCRIVERAVRRLPAARRTARTVERCRDPRHSRQGSGREGIGHPRLQHATVSASSATRSSTRGTRSTCRTHPTGSFGATGRATCATGCTTCSPTTTCSRTTSFENGAAGSAIMYSRTHRLPPQSVHPQPRLRVGRTAAAAVRRCRSPRATSSRTTRAASSSRARTASRFAATSSRSRTAPSSRSIRRSATRFEGQFVRGQHDAARARRQAARRHLRRQLLVRPRGAGPRRRRPHRAARTGSPACSTTCGAT